MENENVGKRYTGSAVINKDGIIGIITEPIRERGVYKGKVTVMFQNANYEVVADPAELTPVNLYAIPSTHHKN